ncbi:SusD/RagB family nutrient-binding outer membrane lipoprotein [Hymenobacter weizhouensis]|uniref:SusD/RagB family nutrient-binding outer membrane lipoprotein n=1 Tax=Hymenobacter sp. YIM 151500-1 TaxID=2987689 RepID=UPI002226BAC7|nr:SusD/RagB family nutrient-binding outer membrane lipoprotein [Hymenobacter sp. YIM 151500-1]UYZ63269.1 SusD/RagB family nutrient-binding outer membrane lipoprotein [Hymenobacter sp. YIM 151500-1]
MNFSRYKKLALILPMVLALGACEQDFDEINTNTNDAEVGTPSLILTNAQRSNVTRYWDVEANMDGGLLIVQHWAKIQYTNEDRYAFRTGSYQNIWDGFYAGGLQDFNKVISLGQEQDHKGYQAVGLIMRSWLFSLLTDMYGDIPYSEALRLQEGSASPKYDKQEDVYRGLLTDLKTAADMINSNTPAVQGDIMYGGSMMQWKKFANSLRLRLAMRVADADAALARTHAAEVLNSGVHFTSNIDNAQVVYLSTTFPNNNPVHENRKTRDDHRISKTIVDKLTTLKDPRLLVYADSVVLHRPGRSWFVGVQNGLTNTQAATLGLDSTSLVGDYFRRETAPAVIMTYAEVLFFKAEAIARGFVSNGVAATEYQNAIRASMSQFGIADAAAVTTYLAQPSVVYNAANYKQSIGEQKWIALFGQGLEAWSEWRRLDYPQLTVARNPVAAAGGRIPVRFIYPAQEQSLNQTNYNEAVARQGADRLTTKLWWDKF